VENESSLSSGTTDEEAPCMTHLFAVPSPIQKSFQPTQSNTAHSNKVTCTATTVTNQGGECSNRIGHGRGGETQDTPLAKQRQGQEVLPPLETAVEFCHFYSGTSSSFKKSENLAVNSTLHRGTGISTNDGTQVREQKCKETRQLYKDGSQGTTIAAASRDNHKHLQVGDLPISLL